MRFITCVTVALVLAACFALSVAATSDNKDEEAGRRYLTKIANEEGYFEMESGLLIKVLVKGMSQKSPKLESSCSVHYKGTLKDGTKFDSSYDRGQPAIFTPKQVIKGWTEALMMMREGDKWHVILPHEIAYGTHGKPPRIPGYAPLTFDLELVGVMGEGRPSSEVDKDIEEKFGMPYHEIPAYE